MSIALAGFGRTVHISDETRDHILVTMWILITLKQFQHDELLLYPLALYFFWAFVRDFRLLFDLIVRSLIVWAYPVWFVLTMAWGAETGMILRTGLQLILTIMICYCAVLRLSARQIMLSVMIGAGWYGVLSALETDATKFARGVFASKNAFGGVMVMLFTASLCIIVDGARPRWLRLGAGMLFLLSIAMIQRSHSATAVLLAGGSFACIIVLLGRRMISGAALIGVICILTGLTASFAAFHAYAITEFDPVGSVLGAFGKDTTLTGRTVLWEYAISEIERHPWLGIGFGEFWTPEDPFSLARRIYDEFFKAYYATFSFHNTYLEIAVHQGLIGAGLVAVTALWLVGVILPGAIIHREIGAIYFLCIAAMTLTVSMTETAIMVPFSLGFMLFLMGGLLGMQRPVQQRTFRSMQGQEILQ
ncbi:hypothetical protein OCH239_15255 [Roseivivax halodurans JCM 10272]|uniref:O-antigen ligase-related domain-containing protein n=1 Tax=Roseivivax halodurans JCM 10272 TaxID=1449350 RepID=X7EAR5_9RHOB|nr:O-antigen ligase family protein [Roseivivax halodurans]ETX12935.1 hypothetical protein OCH239_15255 [Roseivivax halodurans JCM 10272]